MVTDFDRDLAAVTSAMAAARPGFESGTPDAVTRLVHLSLRRAGLTGRSEDLSVAAAMAAEAFGTLGPWPDLCLLQADLDVRLHRLADARQALRLVPGLLDCRQGRAIMADILAQEGEQEAAEAEVAALVEEERTWDHLARLAHLTSCRGDLQRADELLAQAEDEITAKSMRSFAWVEVERGRLSVLAGDLTRAHTHYETAERAYSGHWTVDLRRAELDAIEGRAHEAVRRLERVLARTGKPDVSQALSPLYARLGDHVQARRHHQRALDAFLASADAGEVHYLHHLTELYVDPVDEHFDPAAAVHWARRDLELRPNHLARSALALALHRQGCTDEAVAEMARALSTGLRDPRLLGRAEEVFGTIDKTRWPVLTASR